MRTIFCIGKIQGGMERTPGTETTIERGKEIRGGRITVDDMEKGGQRELSYKV